MGRLPPFPAQVSSSGTEIWDWAANLSEWAERLQRIRELKADIARVDCGGCELWMTRKCPRERNINGHNHGPSMYGSPCSQYAEKASTAALRQKRRGELAALAPAQGGDHAMQQGKEG